MGSSAPVQVLLLLGVGLLLVVFLRGRNTMPFQAGKKLLLGLFVLVFAVAVVFPDTLTVVANVLGVGRGADLLLYALVVAFFFVSLNTYLKFRDLELRNTRLVRRIAIMEAARRRDQRLAQGHDPLDGCGR